MRKGKSLYFEPWKQFKGTSLTVYGIVRKCFVVVQMMWKAVIKLSCCKSESGEVTLTEHQINVNCCL